MPPIEVDMARYVGGRGVGRSGGLPLAQVTCLLKLSL